MLADAHGNRQQHRVLRRGAEDVAVQQLPARFVVFVVAAPARRRVVFRDVIVEGASE